MLGWAVHRFIPPDLKEQFQAVIPDQPEPDLLPALMKLRKPLIHSPLHAAGYAVDPEYIRHDQKSSQEVMEGFLETVEKMAILRKVRQLEKEGKIVIKPGLGVARCPTTEDPEVQAFIVAAVKQHANYQN